MHVFFCFCFYVVSLSVDCTKYPFRPRPGHSATDSQSLRSGAKILTGLPLLGTGKILPPPPEPALGGPDCRNFATPGRDDFYLRLVYTGLASHSSWSGVSGPVVSGLGLTLILTCKGFDILSQLLRKLPNSPRKNFLPLKKLAGPSLLPVFLTWFSQSLPRRHPASNKRKTLLNY
jgi:hypothetical protein